MIRVGGTNNKAYLFELEIKIKVKHSIFSFDHVFRNNNEVNVNIMAIYITFPFDDIFRKW